MRTVMGLLDTYQDAERLIEDLVRNGFNRDSIDLITNGHELEEVHGKKEKGFIQKLKERLGKEREIPDREREYYSEGIRRGGILVYVNVDDGGVDKAVSVMESHGVVDIEKRAEHWRKRGWTRFDEKAAPYTAKEAERERKIYPSIEEKVREGKRKISQGLVRVYRCIRERPVGEKLRDESLTEAEEAAYNTELSGFTEIPEEPVSPEEAWMAEDVGKEAPERTEQIHEKARKTEDDEAFNSYYKTISVKEGEYDDYLEAYLYTRKLLQERRYEDRNWSDIEDEIHADWEKQHPGTWDKYKDTIKYGYTFH